jgi:chemotaxis response regulator CheB
MSKKKPAKASKADRRVADSSAPAGAAENRAGKADVEGSADESVAPSASEAESAGPVADRGVTIVGVGASAGGLDAFSQLLHSLPERPGLHFTAHDFPATHLLTYSPLTYSPPYPSPTHGSQLRQNDAG